MNETCDVIVIGGGPAGMAAAIEAVKSGARRVVLIERDHMLGGILPQCVHSGFGLEYFGEELTGPEYAQRFIDRAHASGIDVRLETMALSIGKDLTVTTVDSRRGLTTLKAGAIVLGMGCRERTRGALNIPGTRPAGVMTAGVAQRLVNIEGYMPGRSVVVLGSGDIGLIMARRMTLEGAEVKMVLELLPYSSGLTRNIVQCLDDFNIPLRLSHTVTEIRGRERLTGVTVSKVDKDRRPIPGTEEFVACDTLLLSVGLIPENELSSEAGIEIDPTTQGPKVDQDMSTSAEGIFACGNAAHVHDIVDFVSEESARAGRSAARFAAAHAATAEFPEAGETFPATAGAGVRYVVPQRIRRGTLEGPVRFYFRTTGIFESATVTVRDGERVLLTRRRDIMTPGEMESVELSGEDLRAANGLLIDVASTTAGGTRS